MEKDNFVWLGWMKREKRSKRNFGTHYHQITPMSSADPEFGRTSTNAFVIGNIYKTMLCILTSIQVLGSQTLVKINQKLRKWARIFLNLEKGKTLTERLTTNK